MPFNESTLAQARNQGASDDEIFQHLASKDDRFRVAREQGASLDDIAKHISKKGGEQNEDQVRNQPQADQEGNARRVPDQQEPSIGSQEGLQADGMLRPKDQGKRERNDKTRLTNEGQTQNAQGGIQGSQARQGMEGQVPARNKEEVGKSGVRPPAQGFFEEIKTEQGKKAGLATLLEEGVKMGVGTVAAGLAETELLPAIIATGGIAALAAPAVGMLAFEGGSELADKILVKPAEKLLGVSEDIEAAKQAAPSVSEAAGYAAMLPFAVKSVAGFAGAAREAAEKAGAEKAFEAGAKEVGKRALGGAVGGAAFEPIRYGVEAAEKGVGATEEAPAPITLESLGRSALTGAVLGGAGFESAEDRAAKILKRAEKEKAKTDAGEDEIASAGLPETSKVAGAVKTDDAIKVTEEAKQGNFIDPNKRAEAYYSSAEQFAEQGDTEAAERALRSAENSHAFEESPADWIIAQRQARVDAIREKLKPTTEETKDATQVRKEQEDRVGEYPQGDQIGQATETGGGDRTAEGGEEPQEVRIGAAAWKNTRTGAIFHGANHEEALEAAKRAANDPEQKDKVAIGDLPKVDTTKASNRETPDFGYITTDGKFVSRDEAQNISEQTGQFKGKVTDRPVLHSNEVQQDFYPETGPKIGSGRPGAAGMGEFQKNRIVEASNAIYDVEKALGRDVKSGNEGDKRLWMQEMSKRMGDLNLSLPELNTLWNQSHEAYRIRNASPNRSIPIEKAVDQIAGNRIQSQRAIATNNEKVNAERAKLKLPPTLPSREITQDSAWKEAAHRIHTNPQYLDELVSEFKTNPTRAANAEEQAALSQHMGDLQNRLDRLYEDHNNAETDAQKAGIDEQINQTIQDIDFVGRINSQAGTEWSGAGRMRAIRAAADFSLQRRLAVEQKARGRKLTKDEARKVADDTKKIEESNKRTLAAEEKARTANQEGDIKSVINQGKKGRKKAVNADDLIEKSKNELAGRKDDGMTLGSSIRNLAKGIVQKRLEFAEAQKVSPLTAEEAENATKVRDVVEETHKIVSGELGDTWSIKQTRDAISGYGVFRNPPKTFLTERISALLGENRAIGKIEDVIKGQAPKKTGDQRVKPSAKQRMLEKIVNKKIRDLGIEVKDPETQLQGALDTARNRAKNAVEELEQIALQGRKLDERTAKGINQLDPDLLDLKGEIAGLKQLIEDTYGKKEVPYEQKVAKMEKIYDNLIARYQREIASGELNKKSSKGEPITSEKLEHQREILNNLREERNAIRNADETRREQIKFNQQQKRLTELSKQLQQGFIEEKGKKTPINSERLNAIQKEIDRVKSEMQDQDWFKTRQEALALQAYKNRLGKAIEENRRRLAENDFAPQERKPLPEDEEVRKLKAENNKLKDEQRMKIAKIEWENRPPLQKALDVSFKIKRAAVLSYLSTIEKLGATSIFIPAFRAPSALAGEVIGRLPVFKEIAKQARQEYGGRIDKEAAMYAKHYWDGIKEAKNIAFKLGRSELDMEFGDGSLIPTGALDVPGKIHEAIKYPTKLANYKLAYQRYLEWGKRNGFDINNEAFKQKAGIEAYKEANASIFLQDNKLVDKYNLLVTTLRKSKSPAEQAIGFALQESLPIVRIPINIISEGLEYQFGLIPGLSKVIKKSMSKEIGKRLQDIEPEEADLIMRQLKKGSVGLMALAIGAALPDFFGGFYRKDSQLDEEKKNFDGITIGGFKIDRRFLHHPAFFPFQIGATIRQVWDENIGDAETLGDKAAVLAKGAAAAQLGLIEEVPFVSFSKETGKMFDPTRLPSTAGEIVRSNIPGFIQETAASLDTNESGIAPFAKALLLSREDVIKRKREGFIDNIKYGLPVFRQDLEEK